MARSRSPPRTRFAVERARRQIDACRSTAEQVRRARSSQLPAGAYRAVVSRLSPTLFDDDCADHRLRYFFLDLTAAGIRSEERRVGKECRSGCSPARDKRNEL